MKAPTRIVLFAGLASTLVVIMAGMGGLLDGFEWWSQDQRFLHARRNSQPLGEGVALVAIDDRALDTIGRWPWSRDVLSMALDEIAIAGARTVASDVLFTDVQSASADAALAAGIGRSPTVLAVNMDEGRMDATIWLSAEGRQALSALVTAIAEDITAEPRVIADRAGLQGVRRDRFLERSTNFKKLAAWKELLRLRNAGTPPADAQVYRLLLTKQDATLENFAERISVNEAFDRDESFALLARFMSASKGEGSAMDAPPLAEFSERAAGVGFVNCAPDRDGQYRRVRPFWRTPYGSLPQFGLAAGLLQLGIAPASIREEPDALVFPDGRRLPLDNGRIYVYWPTEMFEAIGGSVTSTEARTETGVIAIGALIDLANQRKLLAEQERRYRELGADIAAAQAIPIESMSAVPVADAVRAAVKEQGEFIAGDLSVRGTSDIKDGTDAERKQVGTYREWWRLDQEIPASRKRIADAAEFARAHLKDRLVFVGFIATGVMADMINTVNGPRTPGVYFHAAVADMVISSQSVYLWAPWTGWIIGAVFGLICAVIAWKSGAGISTAVTFSIVGAWVLLSGFLAFEIHNLMIPVAVPVLAAIASQAASVSTAAVVNQREKARITRQFRARVSPQLVERLAANPDALSMRGEQRTATILFGDLAGFTTISEKLGSEAVVATLNLYMSAMANELTERRAYVNKFLGDGLLAFWSAFEPEPEQGQLAAEACRACQRVVKAIGERPDRQSLPKISLRLGVATGSVTIGDCGAPPDLNDYTVIGDSANLAARLESANKQFGTAILFCGTTRALIHDSGGLPIVSLGRVVVVGQSVPIDLFTMLVEDPQAGWIESVGRAVEAFAKADFAACATAWDAHEQAFGVTKITVPFREALADPADKRDGVLRLRAK
ncbi:MAG: CHASE2 domain-containing protein [Planctomycetota bacterium]|nr:MAG: CHASE2 domain-containing protein [Planctomycetota bacterium]